MKNQENEGLFSPLLKHIRLRKVSSYVNSSSKVLDVGCGNGSFKSYIHHETEYYGIDRIEPPDINSFTKFICIDTYEFNLNAINMELEGELFDHIVLIAFIEHIKKPGSLLKDLNLLLTDNGKIIISTPHPRGRKVHDILSQFGLCSRSASIEHEDFIDFHSLNSILKNTNLKITQTKYFLLGLNQLFILEKE